jgi:hypothetical protein
MKCCESLELLEAQFDRLFWFESPGVAVHLKRCASCRKTWRAQKKLWQAINEWRRDAPRAELTDAVVARHLRSTAAPFRARRPLAALPRVLRSVQRAKRRPAALVVAASVIVGAFLLPSIISSERPRQDRPAGEPSLIASAQAQRPAPAPLATSSGANRPPRPVSASHDALARKAIGALGAAVTMVAPSRAAGQSEAPAAAPSAWIDTLGAAMQPIGRGLEDAFDFLWTAGASAGGI